jgi:hypothetical protein
MGMIACHLLFPNEAADECRTVVPVGISDLRHPTFVFMEAYCTDPRCDCWRVMLNVVDDPPHPDQATLQAVRDRGRSPSPSPMRRSGPKVGPNDPCPCGSGRKYKTCCRG